MIYELIDSWEDWDGNKYEVIKTEAGSTVYRKNGVLHREDGPAIKDFDGGETWMFEGKRHRADGPAVSEPDGTKEWWEHGVLLGYDLPPRWDRLLGKED